MTIKDNITFAELDNCNSIFIELISSNGGQVGSCLASNLVMDRLYSIAKHYGFKFTILYLSNNNHTCFDTKNPYFYNDIILEYRNIDLWADELYDYGLYLAKTNDGYREDKTIGFREALILIEGNNPYYYFKFENGLHRNRGYHIGTALVEIYPKPSNDLYTLDKSIKTYTLATEEDKKRLGYQIDLETDVYPTHYEYDGYLTIGKSCSSFARDFLVSKVFNSKFYRQQQTKRNKAIESLQRNQGYSYVTYNYELEIIQNSAKILTYNKDTILDHRINKEYTFEQIDERLLDLYEEYKYLYE